MRPGSEPTSAGRTRATQAGRVAAPSSRPAWWLGFDIGGTRTKMGLVRPGGRVEQAQVLETGQQPFEQTWEILLGWAEETLAREGREDLQGIGVAAPGLVEEAFGVRNLPGKVLGIEGFPMRERLEARFGVPVRCVNDGAAATLAEWRFGAARGCQDVVGLTIGTGLGAGVILGGRPLRSRHLAAGVSFGHATIEVGGRTCLCGNIGCAETLVSANAVVGRMRDYVARKVPSTITQGYEHDPGGITFRVLVDAAEDGDRAAIEILARFCRDLGATIITAIHAYDPEIVVLAGGPMAQAEHFLPSVQAYVDRYAFRYPRDRRIPVRRAERSDHAGVLGAVALVMQAGTDPGDEAARGDVVPRPGAPDSTNQSS
jgi:glucokinase